MQRQALPEHLQEVLLVSRYITLYLVDSHPPNLFKFIDPLGNNFKVCIDRKISCSCLPGNNDHCMHTFYVLIKVYQMSEDDPLIYQSTYSAEQLEQIFSGERSKTWMKGKRKGESQSKKGVIIGPKQEIRAEKEKFSQQTFKKQHPTQSSSKIEEKERVKSLKPLLKQGGDQKRQQIVEYQQPKLEKGAVCSICYEELENQTPLLKCPSQCFNYFHIKCLKFWIDYQKKQEFVASCPMCRGKFPQNTTEMLKKSENDFIKHYQSFEVNCSQCNQQIKFKLFRCLLCKLANLCQDCYFNWKHLNHDRYLMKKSKKADWSYPQMRTQTSMAKLDISLKYVKQFKNQQEMKILFGENYSKFVAANLKKETLLEYVVNSFTSVSKEIYKTYKKLDYEQKDIKCMLCKKGKVTEMRRLSCKHFIDEKCLGFLLVNGERVCPYDKQPFLESFPELAIKILKK